LEVGSWELADLKELKFWNLNLEINTTPDLETLIATTARVLASQAEAIVDLGRTWPQHRRSDRENERKK